MSSVQIIELPNYQLNLLLRGSSTLVVSFEARHTGDRPITRNGWAYRLLKDRAEDVLFIKTYVADWYRRGALWEWAEKESQLFKAYSRRVLIGGSMGGYGSLAYSRLLKATEVLAFNPQTTLARDLTPWETRYRTAWAEDWSGPLRDAAEEVHGATYVVSDPYDYLDYAHVRRLRNIRFIPFPFVGHEMPKWLNHLGVLWPALADVIDGRDPTATIEEGFRRRRALPRWWHILRKKARERGKRHALQILNPHGLPWGFDDDDA